MIDSEGREWISKGGDSVGWNDIFAETVSWLLGRRLGVRTPDAAVHVDAAGRPFWLSRRVRFYKHWSAGNDERVVNLGELARMLVLDALVGEIDRHAGNLILEPTPDGKGLTAWAIDSGNALIGQPSDFEALGLDPPDPKNHAKGVPIDALAVAAQEAAIEAEALGDDEIKGFVYEAVTIASGPDGSNICEALRARCRGARLLVPAYLDLLRAIK